MNRCWEYSVSFKGVRNLLGPRVGINRGSEYQVMDCLCVYVWFMLLDFPSLSQLFEGVIRVPASPFVIAWVLIRRYIGEE